MTRMTDRQYRQLYNKWLSEFRKAKIHPSAKALGFIIHTYVNEKERCAWIGRESLAQDFNRGVTTVDKYLDQLIESGWFRQSDKWFDNRRHRTFELSLGDKHTVFDKGNCNNKGGRPENLKKGTKRPTRDPSSP